MFDASSSVASDTSPPTKSTLKSSTLVGTPQMLVQRVQLQPFTAERTVS